MRTARLLFLALSLLPLQVVRGQESLKVYISADMEGVVGVVTGDHLGPAGFEYQKAREWLTEEVNAAIRAARAAGATEILVSDSHGNGENILLDRLPTDVLLVRSWPRPLMMMEGIDETFDAVLFIGYHASTTNPTGVRAHTMSSGTLTGEPPGRPGRSGPEVESRVPLRNDGDARGRQGDHLREGIGSIGSAG